MKPQKKKFNEVKQNADADICSSIDISDTVHTELIRNTHDNLVEPLEALAALVVDDLNETSE